MASQRAEAGQDKGEYRNAGCEEEEKEEWEKAMKDLAFTSESDDDELHSRFS